MFNSVNISEFQRASSESVLTHLMVISHFVLKQTMDKLTANKRYQNLSVVYASYISLLVGKTYSPGDLADTLGISKQACNKTLSELEKAGYIERRKNPQDSRYKILVLTSKGATLIRDGIEVATEIQDQFAETIGEKGMIQLIDVLDKLCQNLAIDVPSAHELERVTGGPVARLSSLLSGLSGYFLQNLITALSHKGFEGLKLNFIQALGLIGPEGGRIQTIASALGVSKQAIAAIALDLEQLGYIVREPDPQDKRQIILRLLPLGQRLLAESTNTIHALQASVHKHLGSQEYQCLQTTMQRLYFQIAEHYDGINVLPAKIQQLSDYLLTELGVNGARALAQQLFAITRGQS